MSRKSTALLVSAGATAAIVVWVNRIPKSHEYPILQGIHSRVTPQAVSNVENAANKGIDILRITPESSERSMTGSNDNMRARASGVPTARLRPSVDKHLIVQASSAEADNDIRGQKFPVSKAIRDGCLKIPNDICAEMSENLAKLSQEPRDLVWAAKMEMLIQNGVLNDHPGARQILNLECRKSLCAVEVDSSVSGTYVAYIGYSFGDPVLDVLRPSPTVVGSFKDSSGNRHVVDLVTFVER